MIRSAVAVVTAVLAATASPALADPCKGALPRPGSTFTGKVRYVGDGDSLCIGPARHQESWVEIRLADFNAPELHDAGGERAKRLLAVITMDQPLVCKADHRSYDRIVAHCTIKGRRLGTVLRARGGAEGGR